MSLRLKILNQWLRMTEKPHMRRADVAGMRRSFEVQARLFFHPPRGTRYAQHRLGDTGHLVPAVTIHQSGGGPRILYLHGGGYVFGSPNTHRAMLAWLSRYSGLTITAIAYRLAPEHPFPHALTDALLAYRALSATGQSVILGGDSAGGGLALALLAEITRLELQQPIGTFVFSPLTDLTFSGDSLRDKAEREVILPAERVSEIAELYLDGEAPDNPRASPLFADFSGVAPVWLTASEDEILLDDTRRMAARLSAQGVDVSLVIERELPHVWPIFTGLIPEAKKTLRDLSEWLTSLSHRPGGS